MPPIEIGPLRPIGAFDNRLVRQTDAANEGPARAVQAPLSLIVSDVFDAGPPPIDAERVAEICRAIETGTYPLIPARVADAIIAAGHVLRSTK